MSDILNIHNASSQTCAFVSKLRVEIQLRRFRRGNFLQQGQNHHQLLQEPMCAVTVTGQTGNDVISRGPFEEKG